MTLLNSLTYSVQIVIQSRKMNIETYLDSLKQHQKSTSNELLKVQIEDYRAFVSELVELGDIMQKRFYIVITYDPASDKKKNFWTRASEVFSPASAAHLNRKQLVNRIEQISRRVANIESQLNSMSITSVRLDTQGLIELYYNVYNPDAFDREPMTDVSKIMHDDESALKNES
jgi:hypothetical protein